MCDRGLRVRKLLGGMRIAVEGEETACGECRCREHVVQVLPGGIAIDFDGDTGIRRGGKHSFPIGDDSRARFGDAPARVGKDSDRRVLNGGDESFCLIFAAPKP